MVSIHHSRQVQPKLLAAVIASSACCLAVPACTPATSVELLYSSGSSRGTVNSDTGSVNLGVRFTPRVAGTVSAVEFYRGSISNTATTVALWDATTSARVGNGTSSSVMKIGWTRVPLTAVAKVTAGHTYVASFLAPVGRYNAIAYGFASSRTVADLSAPSSAGVYTYSSFEALPTSTWRASEYLVSPVFTPSPPESTAVTPTTYPWAASTPTPRSAPCSRPKWTSTDALGQWSDGGFVISNNKWNREAGPQTINACGYDSWSVTSNQPELATDPGAVKTYPDTGWLFSERPLSSFSTITSHFDETSPGVGQYDFAYDLWLNKWGNEVMIWNDYRGLSVPPVRYNAVTVTLDNASYYAWRSGKGYIALARVLTKKSGSVDIRHVLNWCVEQGWLPSASTLTAIEYGVEISSTGGGQATFSLNDFSLTTT